MRWDVEGERPLTDAEAIAQHNFSASEYNIFRQLPQAQKKEAFFNC
jgi:phosphopantetheinyl transferase